jgi:hypothetical protein
MSIITVKISPKIETKEDRGWSPVIHTIEDIWVTKDGRKILIAEMTNEHIQNAIRFMYRNKKQHYDSFNWLVHEINNRGFIYLTKDGAVYFK